jgi:hypothetical protein
MQRSSPVQGRTGGKPVGGVAGGYAKGSAAAAAGFSSSAAASRRATVDAGAKGSLHMMSRNSYLQVRAAYRRCCIQKQCPHMSCFAQLNIWHFC